MKIKVSKNLSTRVISIPPTMGIRKAPFKMQENSIQHLSIVDGNNTLIGIISDCEPLLSTTHFFLINTGGMIVE